MQGHGRPLGEAGLLARVRECPRQGVAALRFFAGRLAADVHPGRNAAVWPKFQCVDEQYLQSMFEDEGLAVQVVSLDLAEERMMGQNDIRRYMTLSYLPSFEKLGLTVDGRALEMRLNELLANRSLHWRHHLAFVHASFQPMSPSSDSVVAKEHEGI